MIPLAAWSEESRSAEPQDSKAHRHLGFYFHLESGAGYFLARNETGSASGFDVPVAISVGGAIVENLILAFEIWGGVLLAPVGPIQSPSVVTLALGLNLTYYFMPANIYLTATPSIVAVGSTGSGCSGGPCDSTGFRDFYNVSIGKFGMRTAVGKEWWISPHWAVGLGLQFSFTLPGEVNFGTLAQTKASAMVGALTLGLTYN
jgi:hypothetical protein